MELSKCGRCGEPVWQNAQGDWIHFDLDKHHHPGNPKYQPHTAGEKFGYYVLAPATCVLLFLAVAGGVVWLFANA